MAGLYLGIRFVTTHLKVGAFDAQGKRLGLVHPRVPIGFLDVPLGLLRHVAAK